MRERFIRWASNPANLTFAVSLTGVVATFIFWMATNRLEPTFVATFGGMLTASGLLAGRQDAAKVEKPPEPLSRVEEE